MFTAVTPGSLHPRVTRTILDTHFSSGQAFLESAGAWLRAEPNAAVLHYVALCEVEDLAQWRQTTSPSGSPPSTLNAKLRAACASALPGIQRLLLAGGRISLTLCVGPLQTMLSEQTFLSDEVRMALAADGPAAATRWDKWAIQLLARRCRRGTVIKIEGDHGQPDWDQIKTQLSTQGFEWHAGATEATYAPRWELRTTRVPRNTAMTLPKRCAVVGAGLAGASVAQALALRGWEVTVLDAHDQPTQGASGLPVGLVVPHVSVDDSPRSRISRVGARLTLQHAAHLLRRGQDWNPSGVLEFDPEANRCLAVSASLVDAGWLASGQALVPPDTWGAEREDTTSLWHAHAGWIKPARLVAAWLAQPGIHVLHNAQVTHLKRTGSIWQLQNALGETLAEADMVVVANAMGALPLLQNLDTPGMLSSDILGKLQALQALYGTVSHGPMSSNDDPAFPRFAVNGSGSLVAHVPTEFGPYWYAGASYETDPNQLQDLDQQHAANWERLNTLLPVAASALKPQFQGQPQHWTGTRCVSHDRLPLVGPVHADASSGLWLSIGMGSRGLSFAALCAELLASRLAAEPLPIEARLAKSLDLHRPRRQRVQ